MDYLQFLFFAIYAATGLAWLYILVAKPTNGNPHLAAIIAALFAGFTAIQIGEEGVVTFFTNHTQNLTGIQVWWDLLMCTVIALFFIVPRARKVEMSIWPWAIVVALTASIGLLAMCARLFWLENARESATRTETARSPA
ncbi:MAG: hypothetical protein V2J51_17350 [Erythrobacter sp.]|jgi:hypothetical protein|nr:hypothetical protein [Erythrobacter sp.]